MHLFYIANACFILEFMSYIILSVCAKIGETLDMKTKLCLHVLHFLLDIVKTVALSWIYDTWWVASGYWLGIAGEKLKTTIGVLKNEKCLPPPRLLCFLKHPPTALCHVMCPATTREKSGHIFTNYHIFYHMKLEQIVIGAWKHLISFDAKYITFISH